MSPFDSAITPHQPSAPAEHITVTLILAYAIDAMSAHDESRRPRGLPPIGGGFADVLENFQVMKYDGELTGTKLVLLEPDDPMFSLLAAFVHLSLRLLNTSLPWLLCRR